MSEINRDPKIKLNSLLTKRETFIVAVFFALVFLILAFILFAPHNTPEGKAIKIEIVEGTTFSRLTDRLFEEKVIPSKITFKIAGILLGAEKKLKPGRYTVPSGLTYFGILDIFLEGKGDLLRNVKIFDGSTLTQIAQRLRTELYIDSTKFIQKCFDKKYLNELNVSSTSLEGYLLPGNYKLFEKSSNEEIIQKMHQRFLDVIKEETNKGKGISYNLNQKIIMASIVDGETNKSSEMPLIAAVYYNRLKKGMKLQADPTVQYLLSRWKRLYYSDLTINSPYNTYKYKGLPPTPINCPGEEAIRAAFNPSNVNYLYFVADGKGGHLFASNFSEHQKNVKIYRQWQEEQSQK